MQELLGRLTALDPGASDGLKIVAYFDALVGGGAGVDALVRGAAALSGAIAGVERDGHVSRRGPDGHQPSQTFARVAERTHSHGTVWLERPGPAHASDDMVVERLALGVDLAEARRNPPSELEIVIDDARSPADRSIALAKLHLTPATRIRIVATRYDQMTSGASTAVVPTQHGMFRATLVRANDRPPEGPSGRGLWVRADEAPQSWESAVVALRISDEEDPVVDAEELGAFLLLARASAAGSTHPDVARLAGLDRRTARVARTLVEAESLRSAAALLGMHHSTLQARHESLTKELGYDLRTPTGRLRYSVAEVLRRLMTT